MVSTVIVSFDSKDSADGRITREKAQSIGMEFAKKIFPGHEALIATHDDGDNHSGNLMNMALKAGIN